MFARILEFGLKPELKKDFITVYKNQVLPILKKQVGFVEVLPFFPEKVKEPAYNISLWATKADAERFERETYPRVYEIFKPFLTTPVTVKLFTLETTVCEHLVESLAA
jgi:hypothetical protein